MSSDVRAKSERDPRLDFFRGLCLITIFINHVPGNVYEHLTSRNFGFSDAAEAFVLMSGIAAGLAYTNAFLRSRANACFAVLKRSVKLYGVHLATTVFAVFFLFWSQNYLETYSLSDRVNLTAFINDPDQATLGFVSLGHQLGYFNILPLYIVLLGLCPLMLQVATRSRLVLISGSVMIWLVAGTMHINFPNYPTEGGWFLNPFSWQLIFVIGLCIGVGVKSGKPLLRYHPFVMAAALVYTLFAAYVIQYERYDLVTFPDVPLLFAGFDKGALPLPRLLHILSLAYIVAYTPFARMISASALARPVVALGKESLAVFAWGSVLALVLQAYKEAYTFSFALDSVLLAFGLFIQYTVALYCRMQRLTVSPRANTQKLRPAG
jgi:hypothetical protein